MNKTERMDNMHTWLSRTLFDRKDSTLGMNKSCKSIFDNNIK